MTVEQDIAAIADGGDNPPSRVRTALSSVLDIATWPEIIRPTTDFDAEDVFWTGSDLADDFTTVTVSGSQTITEQSGHVSVLYANQTSGDWNCALKARTFTIGDSFAVPVRILKDAGNAAAGVIFTDGTTDAANGAAAHAQFVSNEEVPRLYTRTGTLTSFSTISAQRDLLATLPWLWVRLTYQAANTWRKELSPDGISWTTLAVSDLSSTFTPTHVGLVWSVDGGGNEAVATFGPLLKVA